MNEEGETKDFFYKTSSVKSKLFYHNNFDDKDKEAQFIYQKKTVFFYLKLIL
jgi:hypothetical protein